MSYVAYSVTVRNSDKCQRKTFLSIYHLILFNFTFQVYDVTPFMDEHPGGDEVLLAVTGKDATSDFEDIGHSESAREMMEKYHIGEIDDSTIPAKRTFVPHQQVPHGPDKDNDFLIKILQFLVPIMILGLAFAIRQYTKSQ